MGRGVVAFAVLSNIDHTPRRLPSMRPNNDSTLIERCKANLSDLFAYMISLDGLLTLIGLAYLIYSGAEVIN